MSGHSKWHNIRLKKEKTDSAKGKIFTRVSKEIMLAVREGGADPDSNYRLATAVAKAKSVNMPNSNIQRAIDKASGASGDGQSFEETTYEGYGPHGVAFLVEVATDNKNRTVPEIRSAFSKYGGAMGESGCVAWIFDKKGLILVKSEDISEDSLMEIALEAGAEDINKEEDNFEIITEPTSLYQVKRNLEEKKISIESAELTMIPKNDVKLNKTQAESVLKLMEALEDNDDVQNVYANFDIPDEVMATIGEK
jgi:YebC/PmpR family DNA-binding regulatory protein